MLWARAADSNVMDIATDSNRMDIAVDSFIVYALIVNYIMDITMDSNVMGKSSRQQCNGHSNGQ